VDHAGPPHLSRPWGTFFARSPRLTGLDTSLSGYTPGGGTRAKRDKFMSQFAGNSGVPGERSLLARVESRRGGKHKKCTKSKINRFRNSV